MPPTEVDEFLAQSPHPLEQVVTALRDELRAVPGVVESVKWNAPNYALADDFATMSLRRPDAVQLIVHAGARPKPDHPDIEIGPLPAVARRADRNRLVLTWRGPLTADELAQLRTLLVAWTTQLV